MLYDRKWHFGDIAEYIKVGKTQTQYQIIGFAFDRSQAVITFP